MVKRFFLAWLALVIPHKNSMIALGLGAFSVLAFEPVGIQPFAMVSIAGLFWLWLKSDTLFEGFKVGFWFGLGLFGVGVSWLISSMYIYSNMHLAVAILATLVFVAFLSVYVGLAGMLASYLKDERSKGVLLILVFPAIWVLLEWFRSTAFGGFPFLLMGNSHLDTWLDGYAPVFGVLGMSWAMAITAASLLWIITEKAWVGGSSVLAVLWLSAAGLQQVEWVTPVGKPVKVALLQGNISQDQKWRADQFMPTMKSYVGMTKKNLNADIIVWPETAIPSYFDVVQKGALKTFLKDAKLLETDVLLGTITRNKEDGTKRYYNALVNAQNPAQEYRKSHLVPFSEYFPFPDLFTRLSALFDIPFSSFTHGKSGKEARNMLLAGHQVGLSICYEIAFGEELAESLPESKFLITVSNDAWFAHTLEPAQQLQDVKMRALELGREIARSTNTGYTVIVDVNGKVKQQIPAYEVGVLKGDVQPYEGMTFYAEWKQMPILFLLSLIFGFMVSQKLILSGKLFKKRT